MVCEESEKAKKLKEVLAADFALGIWGLIEMNLKMAQVKFHQNRVYYKAPKRWGGVGWCSVWFLSYV